MTTRKAVFAKYPGAVFPVVGIYHMDYIEELFESIEIQLVFHRFPISRSMAFIDASDEEQAVFMGHDD